jgi:hypothetical protein
MGGSVELHKCRVGMILWSFLSLFLKFCKRMAVVLRGG